MEIGLQISIDKLSSKIIGELSTVENLQDTTTANALKAHQNLRGYLREDAHWNGRVSARNHYLPRRVASRGALREPRNRPHINEMLREAGRACEETSASTRNIPLNETRAFEYPLAP